MHSLLVIAKDKNVSAVYISNLLKEKEVHALDINREAYEKAVGIEDVRNIRKSTFLKPFKSKTKAVVIEAYEGITTEAQNSLLKILEEPPANTIIIIITPNKELLLPTILSRCKIIELKEEKMDISSNDTSKLNDYLNVLFNGRVGNKLKLAQDIAKSKEADTWLEKMAVFVRQKLIENPEEVKYLNFLRALQKTYAIIKSTNVNQRIALENLFLSF